LMDSGMASGALLLSDDIAEKLNKKAKKVTASAPFVRKNIGSLSDPEIASLRNGVKAMKDRLQNDPTSWWFQANIHGTFMSDPAWDFAWNKCEHGTYFFFSWHRMYLYFFERILRAASNDPTLTLPYWNYGDPASRALPEVFRLPSDSTNPLYESQRAAAINGGANLSASTTSHANAFLETDFGTNGGFTGFTYALEGTPHAAVHV